MGTKTQSAGADFLNKLEAFGFGAANTFVNRIANRNVSTPASQPAPAPTVQFVPIQNPVPATTSSGGLNPQMLLLVGGGFLLVLLLMKR